MGLSENNGRALTRRSPEHNSGGEYAASAKVAEGEELESNDLRPPSASRCQGGPQQVRTHFFQVIQSATLGKGFIASPRTEVHLGPEMRQIRQAARLLHPFLLFVDNSSPPSGSQNVAAGSG
jgi:hypothetical protein